MNGESKHVILVLVKKAHFAVRSSKLAIFMHRSIVPSVYICGNSGIPFTVVPCLHQRNLYMKRKLREWRTQKCNPCFGEESPLRSTGLQTTGFHASTYKAVRVNLRKLRVTFHRGIVFAPTQSIHEKEATGIENPKM